MSETEVVVETLCFVSMLLIFTAVMAHRNATIVRLEKENRHLREWQGAQSKTPDLGAHRTGCWCGNGHTFNPCPPLGSAVNVEEKARRMCGHCFITDAETCAHLPTPTSVPSSGMECET